MRAEDEMSRSEAKACMARYPHILCVGNSYAAKCNTRIAHDVEQ